MHITYSFSIQIILFWLNFCVSVDGQVKPPPSPPNPAPPAKPEPPPVAPQPPKNTTGEKPKPEPHTVKPVTPEWPGLYNNGTNQRHILGDWLLFGNWSNESKSSYYDGRPEYEYEGYDGWYNNFARPDSGAIDRPLLRRWPAAYKDGTYLPSGSDRPNPLTLSEKLMQGDFGITHSKTGKNALIVFFGQQVVEEILDAQRSACPPEYFNIPIPEGHTYRNISPKHTELPLLRTRYSQATGYSPNNPRQQLNEITPYIDGGLFYGITKQWSDQLRTYANGTMDDNGLLASSFDGLFPEHNTDRLPMANPPPPFHHSDIIAKHELLKVQRFFKLGNPRGNENPFLLTYGVLWFRWHNYVAKRIKQHFPRWNREKIYNEARKWVIASHQQIVMYEWLPAWVPALKDRVWKYEKYDPSIDPQIDQFFQSAAFRFGHTLVVPGIYLRDYCREKCSHNFESWGKASVRTCNNFWRPQDSLLTKIGDEFVDIDRVLMGMAVQLCEREDNVIVEDLRGNVFGPLEFPRRDLMAINIQRGRDHGLPDFNSARKAYGLDPIKSFNYFEKFVRPEIVNNLRDLYGDVNKIDVWVGGILETEKGPGKLFSEIIIDQFRRIRDGDRFWFENKENLLFTGLEIKRLRKLTLYDIIMAVTKMDDIDIQKNVFQVPVDVGSGDILVTACGLKEYNCTDLHSSKDTKCYSLPPFTKSSINESCFQGSTYDYFNNSQASYILTFFGVSLFICGIGGFIFYLMQRKLVETTVRTEKIARQSMNAANAKETMPLFLANEWSGEKQPLRRVIIMMKNDKKQICINSQTGSLLRALDFSNPGISLEIYTISDAPHVLLRTPHNYDLFLHFESDYLRGHFLQELDEFVSKNDIQRENITTFHTRTIIKNIVKKEDRQLQLEKFFRVVFAQAFDINHSSDEILSLGREEANDVIHTELTINEFADALTMTPNDMFVKRMFQLIDKDRNGFVSFREFVDLLIIFANGTEEKKAKLLFDMYDIDGTGYLTHDDFIAMIRSFLETVGGRVDDAILQETVDAMMKRARVSNKKHLYFEDFLSIVGNDISSLSKTKLGFAGVNKSSKRTYLEEARDTIENIYGTSDIKARFEGNATLEQDDIYGNLIDQRQEEVISKNPNREYRKTDVVLRYIELKSKEIFWLTLYTLVLFAIFAERAYYYSVEREHSGLRRIAGYGVTVTRGAASAMMFTYSSLLVTMCRNTITYLRDTVLNKYFPFDGVIEIHKYIAIWALVFTIIHIIGHAFNFYHISTQTADDLTCLFRNYFHSTHELPKFHYWCWGTITGVTGILLTLLGAVMYLFAQPIVRRKIYNWFWYTHGLYPLFFILMFLHGMGRLIQPPFLYYFCLGPIILFIIDTLISTSRKKIEIPVINAEILPSNVTMLEFRKPENFEYKSGQWVRIACLELNGHEYHPFTLSSCPDEDTLTVHIRAVGPWTTNIRTIYDKTQRNVKLLPKIYLDGPYGEGHQDWNTYDVSILIGGGIGVTPFASILKDVIYKSNHIRCKKVYFIWVSRTQKQFEWLIDIIRELENRDKRNLISCHIFITQFYEKFDLRTTLLYICERHYQRISNRSLFTNLRAVTHFGRPSFPQFFKTVQSLHESARIIGVFSCGTPSMTSSVDRACSKINLVSNQRFEHHFKNF